MASEALAPDSALLAIASYVSGFEIRDPHAFEMARYCLIDSLGCGLEALDHPDCTKLLGPLVPGTIVPHGARVPGTAYQLDPATAAFNIGCLVRWLDYNDTYIATQTTHPSDDVGPILAVADHLSRRRAAAGEPPITMNDVLDGIIRAHEIQGVLGKQNALGQYGIDHPFLLKIAAAAVVTRLLGGREESIVNATSLAFFEPSLCVHRFGSNTGPRKGWAAADAASQAVRFAYMAVKGEAGYPEVLTHAKWGFNTTFMRGDPFRSALGFGCEVIQNIMFKIVGPVVIHAQSAIECAIEVHPMVRERLEEIAEIRLESHQRTLRTIDKTGPLRNAADRDHCLQYAVAVALLDGKLTAADYGDDRAQDPRIDRLRALMTLTENEDYTRAFLDPAQRKNPNSIQVFFADGSCTKPVYVEQPVGHPSRRSAGIPLLIEKFERNLARRFAPDRQRSILKLCLDHEAFIKTPVHEFMGLLAA